MVSYDLMETAWCINTPKPELGKGLTMFVHPRTFAHIRMQFMLGSFLATGFEHVTNPVTGRPAIRYYDGYIERRRWVREGWMMFHRAGVNLGEWSIRAN